MIAIDKEQVREELIKKNLLETQKELLKERRKRIAIMSTLLFTLIFTTIFALLENPFVYTFSNIGNLFSYRLVFIIWAIVAGLSIQFANIGLFKVEEYEGKWKYHFVSIATFFLIITAFIPALKDKYPFLWIVHTSTSGLYALFLLLALFPFLTWLSSENPRLRMVLRIWIGVIYLGSILILIFLGKGGLFELWFFSTFIIFLLYLSLVLFEKKIIKLSFVFLKDETNLNAEIEKIFQDLEKNQKKSASQKQLEDSIQ